MAKAPGMVATALFGWALWAAHSAAGQEPIDGVCDESVGNGCVAGTINAAPLPAHPPPLFTAASGITQADLIEPSNSRVVPKHSRRQAVQIDFAHLSQAREALVEGHSTELTINLPNLPLPVVFDRHQNTARGYALTGRVANNPLSSANVVVNGHSVAGNIRQAGKLHTIRTAGAAYLVQTLDGGPPTRPRCEVLRPSELAREDTPALLPHSAAVAQDDAAEDDGTEIDVLVVYTPSGRRSAGGHQGIRTLIELLVQETNQAYSDSDVRQRIRLVAATEVDYELHDFAEEDLRRLTGKADGHMDEVHQIRHLYAADLVLLFRPFGGGMAWIAEDPAAGTAESYGFSVSNWHVFAHELGHNMGLRHHRSDDAGNLPYPYSHGYRFRHGGVQYGTIMSTSQGLLRFSNPRHLYPNDLGVPLGVPGDTPTSSPNGPADSARSLNETAMAIANFRSSATRCHYSLSSPMDITAEGGSFAISVVTSAECPWDTQSLDVGLTIIDGSTGIGDGQVTFTVEQNQGWPREVALRVAGEVYSFRQDGGRPSVAICDRSIGVRAAISAALDGRPCGDIAAGDLPRIDSLTVQGRVAPGDFDGLSGLSSLALYLSRDYCGGCEGGSGPPIVPHLDRRIFAGAGLANLHRLSLIVGRTRTLHLRAGALEGLGALQDLWLFSVSWDGGMFEDTPLLEELTLIDYPRSVLPDGAFRGLNRLTRLWSREGLFETVGSRAFQGLSSLLQLEFTNGRLAQLPPGAFEDLPELTFLLLVRNRLTALRRDQFQGASKLAVIALTDNPIRAIDPGSFSDLPLRSLYLRNLDLTSLDADVFGELFNCTVDLSGNRLTTLDLGSFAGAGLFSLDLSDNYISDIRFLSALSFAQKIDLSGNSIVDVSPLASISNLSTLDLSENQIVDVSPLAALSSQLTSLDLSHNRIDDVSSLLVRGGPIREDSTLFLHGNRLQGSALDDQLAMLRSWGVRVFDVGVAPMDSSALEGEEFEFEVHLSSEVNAPVSMTWQLVFADDLGRQTVLAGALLTSVAGDLGFGRYFDRARCSDSGFCYMQGAGGELTIGTMDRVGLVTVPAITDDEFAEEKHETFAFVLLPGASSFPSGVTLDNSIPQLRGLLGAARGSVSVGLIVDPAGPSHHVPLFLGRGGAQGHHSVLRLVHPVDGSPAHVDVFDGLGRRHGSTTLSTRHAPSLRQFDPSRRAVTEFDSDDLEDGNYDRGLSKGVGAGSSDWHLTVWANNAEAFTYVRHADGFLTSMHDVAPQGADGAHTVPMFNPASNARQRSILRLLNLGTEATAVRITGIDDAATQPGDAVSLAIEPGSVRELSAADLEAGAGDLSGTLGDGQGKWRLAVAADKPILVASLLESPSGRLTNLSTVPDNKEPGAEGATKHHVPLFLSAADQRGRRSFVRVVNRDTSPATVRVRPFDDTVRDYGSVTLTVAAGEAAHFNSHHLEVGGAGLSGGVGAGEGDWRLELEAVADIDVLTYVRHADGFLTSMHDIVRASAEGYVVPIFNAADDDQRSLLRLVNPRGEDAAVTIRGIDDRGLTGGTMRLVVPAGQSRTLSSHEMETGHDVLAGALGDGQGRWRLVVGSDVEIQVMGLLEGPAGHLTNLSSAPHMRH